MRIAKCKFYNEIIFKFTHLQIINLKKAAYLIPD
jgi:hypothetical protein